MTYLLMLAGFLILSGIAAFLVSILKVTAGEGMFLSAAAVILSMYLSLMAGHSMAGVAVPAVIAACGYAVRISDRIRRLKGNHLTDSEPAVPFFTAPAWFLLFGLLLLALVSFYHDFIQRIDELHMWAAAVKYMQEYGRMPYGPDFIGIGNKGLGTSLFISFFQKLTGYSEPHMYAASFLLIWIGWLLPFSGFREKEWKKPLLYIAILYVGSYSLYRYGLKTLYVDMHTAAWAGGLAGWWMNRRHRKTDLLVAAAGLSVLFVLKPSVGPLMMVMVFLFMAGYAWMVDRRALEDVRFRKCLRLILPLLVLLAAAAAGCLLMITWKADSLLPSGLVEAFRSRGGSKEKVLRTFSALAAGITGRPLAPKSDLKITFLFGMAAVLLLLKVSAGLYHQKLSQLFCGIYSVMAAFGYMLVLYLAFLYMFPYSESIRTAGGIRYYSVCLVYLLTIALVHLFQPGEAAFRQIRIYCLLGLLMFLLYGLNTDFLAHYTGWNKRDVEHYKDITKSASGAKEILQILAPEDKVYFLNQDEDNEFPQNTALYYLENQVSNYNREFWKLTENGSITRLRENESPVIADFPQVLTDGGYTYVWIYRTDEYLSEHLPEIFEGVMQVEDSQLYRVSYEGGQAAGLELVSDETGLTGSVQ